MFRSNSHARCNLGTRLALVVGMERTKNDKQDPTVLDGHSAKSAGLSSAMHDIRMLSTRYQAESEQTTAGDSLHLAGVTTMQPSHILMPRESSAADRWKAPALMLLMLLGLSTSALALSLYAGPDTLVEPVFFETKKLGHVDRSALTPSPKVELPKEEPRFETTLELPKVETPVASPSASNPQSTKRAAVVPKTARRSRDETVESTMAPQSSTCDEVACLIDSSDPCCSQYASVAQQASLLEDAKPYRPSRTVVMTAMRGIEEDVLQCFDEYGETGLASVDFVIQPDGSVREVELTQGSLRFRACVRKHVRTLDFGPLKAPFKMSFPFRK